MNTPMTAEELERELHRQAKAEQREYVDSREHDDPAIDQYRLVNRVLKQNDIPALPKDFAARVTQQAQDFEERAQFENSALTVMIIIAVIASMFFALPLLVQALQNITATLHLPWPMLWAATFALGFAAMIDKFSSQYRLPKI